MTRLPAYLAYHQESRRLGDIDPSQALLRYVSDRFEINMEQRYWLAFLYGLTYNGASAFYVYNEFPDYENVDIGRMDRWWYSRGRQETACTTDRRWVRSSNQFVPAVQSYQKMLKGKTQEEFFTTLASASSPEARYDAVLKKTSELYSFGQFALFIYLEAIDTVTPLNLVPTDLDLNKAWSCRNGLAYAYGLDEYLTMREMPTPLNGREPIATAWADLRSRLQPASTVWNIETTLCAFRKYKEGKRYIGSYLDRQAMEIAKMAESVPDGVAWDVLWDYRRETYEPSHLLENVLPSKVFAKKGVPNTWKAWRELYSSEITNWPSEELGLMENLRTS